MALDLARPLEGLMQAAAFLGLDLGMSLELRRPQTVAEFWESAVAAWKRRHVAPPSPDRR
jgi:hypothetical protein